MFWTCLFRRNSMNNLLSYCGLTDARMRASEKDLPVPKYEQSWQHAALKRRHTKKFLYYRNINQIGSRNLWTTASNKSSFSGYKETDSKSHMNVREIKDWSLIFTLFFRLKETDDFKTICECSEFGAIAVIVEMSEHFEVNDKCTFEEWVKYGKWSTKICAFFFSFSCFVLKSFFSFESRRDCYQHWFPSSLLRYGHDSQVHWWHVPLLKNSCMFNLDSGNGYAYCYR